MTFYFRGLDPMISRYLASNCKFKGDATIDGKKCDEYVLAKGEGYMTLYIDREHDSFPALITYACNDLLTWSCKIQNDSIEGIGRFPSSWLYIEYADNNIIRRVSSFQVVKDGISFNQAFEDSVFDIAFPVGCRVADVRNFPDHFYFVQQDGSFREFDIMSKQFLDSVIEQPRIENTPYHRMILAIGITCGIVALASIYRQRLRSRRRFGSH